MPQIHVIVHSQYIEMAKISLIRSALRISTGVGKAGLYTCGYI